MTYCSSQLEPSSDRSFDTCLARLRDPDVQSLLDSLDVDPPPRFSLSSPCCPPLTPPLTPLSPQHTPVATTSDMLQSVRDMGTSLRRHSALAESPVTPVEERMPCYGGSSRQFLAAPSDSDTRCQLQQFQLSSLRGVIVFLPHNLPGSMSGMSDQPAFIDTVTSTRSVIRLLSNPNVVFSVPSQDLARLTPILPNTGDTVKLIKGPWAGRKGKLASRHTTSSVVMMESGEQLTVRNDHLGKYYGRQTSGYLSLAPDSSTSSLSSPSSSSPSSYSPAAQPIPVVTSNAPQLSQTFHSPPSPSPSPSTPTNSYPPSYAPQSGYLAASSPHPPQAPLTPLACRYGMLSLHMTPPAYPATTQCAYPQRSLPSQFPHGVLDLKQNLMCDPYRRPRPQQLLCSDKQLKEKRIVSNVEKVLECLLKRPSPPAWRSSVNETSRLNGTNTGEVVTSSMKISSLCPITKQKMQYPCRGLHCKHLQCFDAKPFLELAFKRTYSSKVCSRAAPNNSWRCPVCGKMLPPTQLFIDKELMKVIADTKATELEHKEDGQWEPIQQTKQPDNVIDLTIDSDDDDDEESDP